YGINWNYGIDLSYRLMKRLSVYASASNAVRFPTFTDLYYSGPTNQGNINLKPEHAANYELGLKLSGGMLNANIAGFHRRATDVIDWVKVADEEKWHTMNHTHINTTGLDIQARIAQVKSIPLVRSITASYTLLHSDKESYELQSYYALDYLKHKLAISLNHEVYKQVGASWTLQWNSRVGTYTAFPENIETSYTPFAVVNFRLYADFGRIMTFVDAQNLSNERYVDIGNIEQPGRWVSVGFRYSMELPQRKAEEHYSEK
ncbi:MAG: TonB-dependent receptor, partial [Bacteroidales bacterium]|nr:TonB-dependent receptor [Bacteroidales bacterium]